MSESAAAEAPTAPAFENAKRRLLAVNDSWLVSGVAGFIGSHLLEFLLRHNQNVTGIDNFSTGSRENLNDVRSAVSKDQWSRFSFVEGDIRELDSCERAVGGARFVLHQAALGSIPRSIKDPISSNASNVTGFLNLLAASKDAGAERFVYASSSSVYGDHPGLPKTEQQLGRPLSPYAVTKLTNELYARVFSNQFGLTTIGFRYFNVFGPRQDPNGPYAAVIPRWIDALMRQEPCAIFGDGETSRDFCFIDNVVQANVLAAVTQLPDATAEVLNVACGERTTLNTLHSALLNEVKRRTGRDSFPKSVYSPFREGDIRHSLADISRIQALLGYEPTHSVTAGLPQTVAWFCERTSV